MLRVRQRSSCSGVIFIQSQALWEPAPNLNLVQSDRAQSLLNLNLVQAPELGGCKSHVVVVLLLVVGAGALCGIIYVIHSALLHF